MVDVASINVAEFWEKQETQDLFAKAKENPEIVKLLDSVESAEDAFNLIKDYVQIKLEDFKVIFNKFVDYFKDDKVTLEDEVLDSVAGGWSFSSWWSENKWGCTFGSIVLACAVTGLVAGACLGGGPGAIVGLFIGGTIGLIAGAVTAEKTCK